MDEFLKLFDDEPAHLHSSCHSYLPSSPLTDGSSAASVISLSSTSEEPESGSNPRKRKASESTSEDEAEDPSDLELPWLSEGEAFSLPENITSFLKSTFTKSLSREKRRVISMMCPKADSPMLSTPVADKDIASVLGREFPTDMDRHLSRVQSSVLSSAAPLLNLWSDLTLQEFTGNQDELIPVKTVLEVCQQTLALVGNASSYISETRRSVIIDKASGQPRGASEVSAPDSRRGQTPALFANLEVNHEQPVDTPNSVRLPYRVFGDTTRSSSTRSGRVPRIADPGGGIRTEGSYRGNSRDFRVFQPNLCRSQERWWLAPSHQPQEAQPIYPSPTFQDGKYSESSGDFEERRLHDQAGPQGCISDSPYPCGTQTVPEVHVSGETLSVQNSPLWASHSPTSVYEATKASRIFSQITRCSPNYVHRRYPVYGRFSNGDTWECPEGNSPITEFGICDQLEKECPNTEPKDGVLGPLDRLRDIIPQCPRRKSSEDLKGMSSFPQQAFSHRERSCSPDRPLDVCQSSSPSRTLILQAAATLKTSGHSQLWDPRWGNNYLSSCTEGLIVLDPHPPLTEWEKDQPSNSRVNHFLRCISDRLGSSYGRCINWRSLDERGEDLPHKLSRINGSLSCSKDFCSQQVRLTYHSADRQYHSHILPEQERGHTLPRPLRLIHFNLAVVFGEEIDNPCHSHSRLSKLSCRLSVQERSRIQRLDARSSNLYGSSREVGLTRHRSICSPSQHAAQEVLQLLSRSGCRGNRRSLPMLEGANLLCLSPICTPGPSTTEAEPRQCQNSNNSCTILACTSMVSSPNTTPHGLSHSSPAINSPAEEPLGGTSSSSSSGSHEPSRLESLRASSRYKGLSTEAFNLLCSAWRGSTEKSYAVAWRKWSSWCQSTERDPISASLEDIVEFLTSEFQAGFQYSTINSLRSALSATLPPIDGTPVGQHPLISRLLQGIFNQRPPLPKYNSTWDVNTVIVYIRDYLGQSETLSLKDLSCKLAMLLALSSAARSSDLHLLDLRFITFHTDEVQFQIAGLSKTRRSGPPRTFTIKRLPGMTALCPIATLETYISATCLFRGSNSSKQTQLFLALNQPHRPVSSCTISRWIKSLMTSAGINTASFGAHSTRAASSSAARKAGLPLAEIMKSAGWSRSSTFERFYHKPIVSPGLSDILISSGSTDSQIHNNC